MSQPPMPPAAPVPQAPPGYPPAYPAPPAYVPQPVGSPPPPPPLPPLPPPQALVPVPVAPSPFHYEPPKPKPSEEANERSLFWRVVRWPFKQLLKGIYHVGYFANKHRLAFLGIVASIAIVVFGMWTIVTKLTAPSGNGQTVAAAPASVASSVDTPFTIVNYTSGLMPLDPAVITYLNGLKTYDAQKAWNTFSPDFQKTLEQNGVVESQLAQLLAQEKAQGVQYQQFIYTGSFSYGGGAGNYTIECLKKANGQLTVTTFYFVADGQGHILQYANLNAIASGN